MSLFHFKWLRQFIRRHTAPIPYDTAAKNKRILSIFYMLLSWNAFGFVCYMIYTGRNDWAKYYGLKSEEDAMISPGRQFASTMGIQKAKVIRYSGLQKLGEFEINDQISNDGNSKKN